MPVSDTHTQTHRHKSSCTRHVHSRICLASKLHPAQIERMYLCWTIQNSTINLTKKKWINTVKWTEKELSIEAGRALCGHRTEETLLWACVSTISFLLLYCMSLFFLPPPPPNFFHFCWRRGRGDRGERRGVAISFRAPAHLIGSWQHMEMWGRFAHAHFWGNKYLPEGGRERERKRGGESGEKKKILISLQTRWEIKVGKTYPSKDCRVSCKMEIFPKLTDPV